MLNSVFSSEGYDHNDVQQCYTSHSQFDDEYITKQDHFFVQEDAGDDLWSSYEFFQEASLEKGPALASCDPLVAAVSPPIQAFQNPTVLEDNAAMSMEFELSELLDQKEKSCQQSIQSLPLLNNYKPSLHRLNRETPNRETDNERRSSLSTEEIMRVAAARYIELSANGKGNASAVNFACCHLLSGFSNEEIQNIDLASLLLAAAEVVSNKQYGRANNLLRRCCLLSSFTGNPVQRIVYYFSDALQERIDRETGRLSPNEKRERSLPAQAVIQETGITSINTVDFDPGYHL